MKKVDVLDLDGTARELLRACELQGERSLFERAGEPVGLLISWDEYVALRETIDIMNEPFLYASLEEAEEQIRQGKMLRLDELQS